MKRFTGDFFDFFELRLPGLNKKQDCFSAILFLMCKVS